MHEADAHGVKRVFPKGAGLSDEPEAIHRSDLMAKCEAVFAKTALARR